MRLYVYEIHKPCVRDIQAKQTLEEKVKKLEEIASILGVHYRTVYLWVRSGKIHATQIGKRWYVTDEEMRYILENGLREEE